MQTPINNQRRQFLQYSFFGAAMASLPGLTFANADQIKSEPTPNFNPDIEIEFTARPSFVSILKEGAKTKVQRYYGKLLKGPAETLHHLEGNYLGPILNFVKGQKVRVFFYNKLNEPSIIHWHGLHVPQKSDGHPMYTIQPGERYVYEFEVMNRAGTSFYHSHAHELTGDQVYFGLAGMIKVTDDEEKALNLPQGEFDLPFVIQDRKFNTANQLKYVHGMMQKMMGFLGDTIVINGKADAEFSVKTRAYRFRALNGSNSRIYKLGWEDGTPLTAIGTDACLLEKPETRPYIMLAPGERVDLWLDFSGREVGSKLVMYSLPFTGTMPAMYEKMHGEQGGMMDHGKDSKPSGDKTKSHKGMSMENGDSEMKGMQHGGDGGMGMMKMMDHGNDSKSAGGQSNEHGKMSMGGMGGMMSSLAQGAKFPIATFKITAKASDSPELPSRLVNFERLTIKDVDNSNKPIPIAISEKPMAPQLNGKSFSMDKVLDFEKVKLGSIKKIKIFHDHGPAGGKHDSESKTGKQSEHGGKSEMKGMKHSNDSKAAATNAGEHGNMPMGGDMKGMDHKGGGMGMMGGMDHGQDSKRSANKAEGEHGSMSMGGGMKGMDHEGGGMGMMGGMGESGMMLSMAHPIHLHGQQYQVLSRKIGPMGSDGYETVKDGFIDTGWKDTVLVMPGEEVEILKPFQDFKGLFLYHCHNLEHEGLGMMRQFYVE
ncbi:multicopper oxidase family protein [Methylicorpusculum sp.]|uniref:multicopper oxidase family protein n=1 Tax=Methylicorpusculum sp. TaxID=2713644 RepID=UPI00272FF7EA|nr:multicopper oxidase domain-containing protein [Methylicorpusculum sp.]MDP2177325.1 multicopper oxidase domain-containing protein [Methylicorpusculum sp.]MDP3531028.1 multicopper oxidase domain-containing protein [Methylicorpusculum sp.]MDZ4153782.1 multicopper oxidase domain-containing protein [Methylicorpusculum sp.]